MMSKKQAPKYIRYILLALCVAAVIALTLWSSSRSSHGDSAPAAGELEITDLDVGKADAAVIRYQGSVGLIDTGTEEMFSTIAGWLTDRDVAKIDYMILTHYDKDHIGSAVKLLDAYTVGTVYYPDYESEKKHYPELMEALGDRQGDVRVSKEVTFSIGDVAVEIAPAADPEPLLAEEDNRDNNMSLVTLMTLGTCRFLFMGDTEEARMQQMIDSGTVPAADWIKMPHHGHYHDNEGELLSLVAPKYAVISTSVDKEPSKKRLKLLQDQGIAVYDTMGQDVTTLCDGQRIQVR